MENITLHEDARNNTDLFAKSRCIEQRALGMN